MDVNLINPVLEAMAEILPQIGFQSIEKKNVSLHDPVLSWKGIVVNISMMGSVKGTIVIGMGKTAACSFASAMMMGMEVSELNGLAQSAISEMANMVCANACTRFSRQGVDGVDISPPVLLVGEAGKVTLPVPKVVTVEFLVDGITLNIHVGLRQ